MRYGQEIPHDSLNHRLKSKIMKSHKPILFTLVAIVFIDAIRYLSWVGGFNFAYETYISAFLIYISIIILGRIAYKENSNSINTPKLIQFFLISLLLWNVFSIVRGIFLASDYWDWKFLFFSSFSFSFIPLVFFVGKNLIYVKKIFRFILKYLFPFGFLLIPLTLISNEELYSRLMIPVSLFIILIPYLKFKWKILVVLVAVTSILMVIGFRSNLIKIFFSLFLLLLYILYNYLPKILPRLIHLSLFIIPIALFILAIRGEYNIFAEMSNDEELITTNKHGDEENLMTDTRTFLYAEVLTSLNNSENWIIGESAVGSYETNWFYDDGGAMKGKRYGSEVGILNILLRNGIIGVLIYLFLLFTVSFYAINYSSNILSKMLGIFIAFRWTYSFVEEFTQYDLNFYFFWLIIGLVSSNQFRSMSDLEVKKYFELK